MLRAIVIVNAFFCLVSIMMMDDNFKLFVIPIFLYSAIFPHLVHHTIPIHRCFVLISQSSDEEWQNAGEKFTFHDWILLVKLIQNCDTIAYRWVYFIRWQWQNTQKNRSWARNFAWQKNISAFWLHNRERKERKNSKKIT